MTTTNSPGVDFRKEFSDLLTPPPHAAPAWLRQRGYRLETVLAEMLKSEGLEPRLSYKAPGEQIDGSFVLDGRVFLLEAKWHADEQPASTLYAFKGKVDGKLVGTLGVFISMSGYSEDAISALQIGKSLSVVLFDGDDMTAAISGWVGFRPLLMERLRLAAEEGTVYVPSKTAEVSAGTQETSKPTSPANAALLAWAAPSADYVIICEGESDYDVLARLCQRILVGSPSGRRVSIMKAGGKLAVPAIVNSLSDTTYKDVPAIVVVDSDGDVAGTQRMLAERVRRQDVIAIVPDPTIESWFGLTESRGDRSIRGKMIDMALTADLDKMASEHAAFRKLREILFAPRSGQPGSTGQ